MKSEHKKDSAQHSFFSVLVSQAICFCLMLIVIRVFAQSPAELYSMANQSYKSKQYAAAAEAYEKLVSEGYKSAQIFYNLGNCYYKIDSNAKCILSYERAMKLAPKDEDIRYNLKLARLRSIDNIQPVPQLAIITWWNNFISFNSSNGWGLYALISIWISVILSAVYFFIARKKGFTILAFVFLFLSFFSVALAVHQQHEETRSDTAVVTVSSLYVKSAPDAGSSDLFVIHEGTRIQIIDKVGEWNKVTLEDGKVGWILINSFERI